MSFDVVVQPRARADLSNSYDWIAERSPEGALRWFKEWEKALLKLSEDPYRFGFAPENQWSSSEVRQIVFRARRGLLYRAIFAISGTTVSVLHVRGPGQQLISADDL